VHAAQIASAQAELDHAKRDLERKLALGRADAISLSERERSKADHDRAVAALAAASAQERGQRANLISVEAAIRAADVQIRVSEAVARQKEAAVRAAQVDLDRTEIRSPIDGIVVERNVDVGQTVATSLQSPTLLTIAEDLSRLQVETYVDETDIGRIAPGQRATFTVSAFPNDVFDGTVKQIRKAPQVIQNVVTYIVVISVANDDQKLLPGMTATIRIVTGEVAAAIKVPNAALRFRPMQLIREARQAAPDSSRRGARRDAAARQGEVYVVAGNGEPLAITVRVGVSDGQFTEIQGDTAITEGTMVIVGQSRTAPSARRGLLF
jgi:HlyD family secretion protein